MMFARTQITLQPSAGCLISSVYRKGTSWWPAGSRRPEPPSSSLSLSSSSATTSLEAIDLVNSVPVVSSLATADKDRSSSTSEESDSDPGESSADFCQGKDEVGAGEDGRRGGFVVVSGTLVVDGRSECAVSLLGLVAGVTGDADLGRPGEPAVFENGFPTLREPTDFATSFLGDCGRDGDDDDGGGFLRPDLEEATLLTEGAVDAPGGDGEEDDDTVEARTLLAGGAVNDEEARDDVVPSAYCFWDDVGEAALPLVCVVAGRFLFLFFPSVKSGFLLWLSPPTFGFFAFDVGSLFLPLRVKFLSTTTTAAVGSQSIRDFRFFAGTERASRLQASSLAAPSQDLLDSGVVHPTLLAVSGDASASVTSDLVLADSSGSWHWGPGRSPCLHRRFRFFRFFRFRHLNLSLPSFSCIGRVGQVGCCCAMSPCWPRCVRSWCRWRTLCSAPNIRLCRASTWLDGAARVSTLA